MLTFLRNRAALQMEILALRHQVLVFQHQQGKRPRLNSWDRLLWIFLTRFWPDWRSALLIVQPATVVKWHREGFRRYWKWKSHRKHTGGREKIPKEVQNLIRRMCAENPLWGAPHIHGGLLKLGFKLAESSVSRYMIKPQKPPSQTWKTFLENHADQIVAIDFFTVPTIFFRVLHVLILMSHDRRRIVHFGVTTNPTAAWVAQQIREAFPWDSTPRFLLHDRDSLFKAECRTTIRAMGIESVMTGSAPKNGYCERVIGSICRECLDHVIVLNEKHLRRTMVSYLSYYHGARTHLSLKKD